MPDPPIEYDEVGQPESCRPVFAEQFAECAELSSFHLATVLCPSMK